jgi:hypothetical protein
MEACTKSSFKLRIYTTYIYIGDSRWLFHQYHMTEEKIDVPPNIGNVFHQK